MKSKLSLGIIVTIIVVLVVLLCCCACPFGCGSISYSSGQSISKEIMGNTLPEGYVALFGIDLSSLSKENNQVNKMAFIVNTNFSSYLIAEGKFEDKSKIVDEFYEVLGDSNQKDSEYNISESGTIEVNNLTLPRIQIDKKSQDNEKLLGTYLDSPDKTILVVYSDDTNVYNENNMIKFIQLFKLPEK